jgi:hypothetical protein
VEFTRGWLRVSTAAGFTPYHPNSPHLSLVSSLHPRRSAKNIKNKPEALARVAKRTLIVQYSGEIEALRARLATQIAQVRRGEGGRPVWRAVGAARLHDDACV